MSNQVIEQHSERIRKSKLVVLLSDGSIYFEPNEKALRIHAETEGLEYNQIKPLVEEIEEIKPKKSKGNGTK